MKSSSTSSWQVNSMKKQQGLKNASDLISHLITFYHTFFEVALFVHVWHWFLKLLNWLFGKNTFVHVTDFDEMHGTIIWNSQGTQFKHGE